MLIGLCVVPNDGIITRVLRHAASCPVIPVVDVASSDGWNDSRHRHYAVGDVPSRATRA